MPQNRDLEPLLLPALRARMGDWMYYVCFLTMREIANRISIIGQIHRSRALRDLLQRELRGRRSTEIKDYLLSQPQRFFNALVVGSFGGDPKWYELDVKPGNSDIGELPEHMEGALGILRLDGTEVLFAVDGQHRVAGMKEAIAENPDLGEEEVCVLLVAGVLSDFQDEDPEGFERTRRLFTTLNRYAKPVSKMEIIALDEDDVVAIVTRRLVEEHPLFRDKVAITRSKNMPVANRRSLTTIVALYDALDVYLRTVHFWTRFKRFRPSDEEVAHFLSRSLELWSVLVKHFPPLQELQESDPGENLAGGYRNEQGGHLLFRPIGFLLIVRIVKRLVKSACSLDEAVRRVSKVPMDMANDPWVGLLWDAINRRMVTSSANQKAAEKVFFYAVGGDLGEMRSSPGDLKQELAGLLNVDVTDVNLNRY